MSAQKAHKKKRQKMNDLIAYYHYTEVPRNHKLFPKSHHSKMPAAKSPATEPSRRNGTLVVPEMLYSSGTTP